MSSRVRSMAAAMSERWASSPSSRVRASAYSSAANGLTAPRSWNRRRSVARRAALGGSVEIPTLDGKAQIRIPPETQSGQTFRLRNKGIKPVRASTPGDLYCHVAIETPVHLTSRQKELLREFEEISAQNSERHNPRAKSFMDKVRDFFAG